MNPRNWFVGQGIGIFPLKPRSKEPACKWLDYAGPVTARNYGVRLGLSSVHAGEHLVVVDTDEPDADAWANANLPATPFVVTTGRGAHRYFRLFEQPATRFIHRDGLTIELKSGGQYVVGPGSLHPSGVEYRAADWSWSWFDLPLFPVEFLIGEREPGERRSSSYEFPDEVAAGERHDALFRLIRQFKGLGAEPQTARAAVTLANQHRCKPPLREDPTFDAWFERAWNLADRPLPERDPFDVGLEI